MEVRSDHITSLPPDALAELFGLFRQMVREAVREEMRPPLVSVARLADELDCCAKTIDRRRAKLGLPWRNMNGAHWAAGDGPKYVSRDEWEEMTELNTRTVTNAVRSYKNAPKASLPNVR